jgi:ubiquinone/menaquinone biosynthesis C-methylase UbiE
MQALSSIRQPFLTQRPRHRTALQTGSLLAAQYGRLALGMLWGVFALTANAAEPATSTTQATTHYSYSAPHRDGIGKIYQGREISHVMGHQGAAWLERQQREREERTDLLVNALGLSPDAVVADIGAGTGYFSFRLSPLVPAGKVMAVDIQAEMLDIITRRSTADSNVVPVLGTVTSVNLAANSVDLVLLVDAYHEFSHPREMGESLYHALKPGGRLALVEYRAEDPTVRIKRLHKMSEAQAIKEMVALGFTWLATSTALPQQHLLFFEKPAFK